MKLLLIGGTYFLGRVFTMMAYETHELHLIHRGTYSMKEFGVTEHILDRHDAPALASIERQQFDAVIDFCGYEPGDIELIFRHLNAEFKQYIFVSTADVYERTAGIGKKSALKAENAPLEYRSFGGQAGEYITKKVQLEKELKNCCRQYGTTYTIVRPSILYGPYNYAPREAEYIRQIVQEGRVCFPADADGAFQFVYVKDAALMLLALCQNQKAENEAYNLCADEVLDYADFLRLLKASSDRAFHVEELVAEKMLQQGMFLPFPVTAQETQLYDGRKITEITGLSYTPAAEGMKKAYAAFARVFQTA